MKEKIIDYHGTFVQVRDDGEIKVNGSVRQHYLNADGYPVVSIKTSLGWRSVGIHILMAMAFVPNDNPKNKTEVNHKDFNRENWKIENLEWLSHADNIRYSSLYNRHAKLYGLANPNYNNHTLHNKYQADKNLAKEKQSRPRGLNGRARKCVLCSTEYWLQIKFDCQRDAVDWLINMEYIPPLNKEYLIKRLKECSGYRGWKLNRL